MATPAGKAVVEIGLNSKALTKGLSKVQAKIKKVGAGLTNIGAKITAAGLAGVAPFALATKTFANFGDQIAKTARRTGVSATAISQLAFAAERSGETLKDVEGGIKRLARNISDAGRGLSTPTEALKAVGVGS